MNSKVIAFVVIVLAIVAIIFFLPTGEQEIPRAPQTSAPTGDGMMGGGGGDGHNHAPGPAPSVDSLHVAVKDSNMTDIGAVTLPPNVTVALAGTDYSLRLTDFYTHLVMQDGKPINVSPHPDNIAARIEVLKGGEVIDYTWTFEKVPFFRMGDMGGEGRMQNTGLAFSLDTVYGLAEPHAEDTNP